MHHAPDRQAQFEVGLQLDIARLYRERVVRIGHRPLTERAGRPAAHAVAAAGIELPVEGHSRRVAIGHRHAAVETPHESRHLAKHYLAADAQVRTEILRIFDAEDFGRLALLRPRIEQPVHRVDQVARRLQIEADIGGVAAQILTLVVIAVAERKAADKLGAETVFQVFIRRLAEEGRVQPIHIDDIDIDGPQRERRVTVVGPLVGDSRTRKRTPIIGAVLKIDRKLHLGLRLVHRTKPPRTPRHQKTREGESGGNAEFRGALFLGVGRLHKLVSRRKRNVQRLRSPEDVAVLVTDGSLQSVETRRRTAFEIDLETLLERRGAQNIALQIALLRKAGLRGIRRGADEGDVIGDIDAPGLLDEGDLGALEIAERHQVGIGAVHLRRIVDVVGIERHRLTQNGRTQVRTLLVDDIQTAVIERIEPRKKGRIGPRDGRIVRRKDVDPVDAVDHVVVHHGLSAFVVTRKILLDIDLHIDLMVSAERVGDIVDVVDRKVVVAALLEESRDALPLAVEHRDVENPPRTDQRIGGVGQDDLFEELVLKIVRNAVDAVRLALPGAVDDFGAPAARGGIDFERRLGREEPARVHIDLQVLRAPLGQAHVEQHGFLPDLAFPVVPPVLLARIGLLVEPDIEIRPQKTLVGGLAHVFFEVGSRDALLAGRRFVGLDRHLLQQVLPFGNLARNAARGAKKAQHGDS